MKLIQENHGVGIECAGCGVDVVDVPARVFCPDCSMEHPFCPTCAEAAVEPLAA